MSKTGQLTPMLRQYLEVKSAYPDAILLYRMGDFFELFFEDAIRAAPILEVVLTARHKGGANEVPMCGVPHHAIDSYLGKLVRAGLKVAICDQVENPAQARGLVKREVTRVVTPGTISQPDILDGNEANYLCASSWDGTDSSATGAGAFLDVSTGSFFIRRWNDANRCIEDLALVAPREMLIDEGTPEVVRKWLSSTSTCTSLLDEDQCLSARRAKALLERHFEVSSLRGFGLESGEPAVAAAGRALFYAQQTQFSELSHIRAVTVRRVSSTMVIDATTLRNLEVFRNQIDGGSGATLLKVIDRTLTAAGGRRLREWVRRPLIDPDDIRARLDAVEELIESPAKRESVREGLSRITDIERILSRAVLGTAMPRELAGLRDSLRQIPLIVDQLKGSRSELLSRLSTLDPADLLFRQLESWLEETPAGSLARGGVIGEGVDEELDRSRSLAHDSKAHIMALEVREREATGIASLKIRFNKVFGYYLEITKANQHLVPQHYIRKQTLVNAERYITPEVKELEEQILDAESKQLELEMHYYELLLCAVAATASELRALASEVARIDVLCSFAETAIRRRYCRPRVGSAGQPLVIEDGRHPVVEVTGAEDFVPNDIRLDSDKAGIVLLTGPNMGGKSTFLRQTALIVLLAQIGSFVPAARAELGAVDRIFTRVGASDDLARGESTFMVEMIETANILHNATKESLVILDEVGRGTSTFDGLSLAWSIVEFIHERISAKTLFATHYHELTELAAILPRVVNLTMSVKEWDDKIIFLRRVVAGRADKSYGLHVARLAGIPASVVDRAEEVLAGLETDDDSDESRFGRGSPIAPPVSAKGSDQLSLFASVDTVVADLIRQTELDQMTPLAALNLLHSLKDRL